MDSCREGRHVWIVPVVLGVVTACQCGAIDAELHHNQPGSDFTTTYQFTAEQTEKED
jgi:hypothetical protein